MFICFRKNKDTFFFSKFSNDKLSPGGTFLKFMNFIIPWFIFTKLFTALPSEFKTHFLVFLYVAFFFLFFHFELFVLFFFIPFGNFFCSFSFLSCFMFLLMFVCLKIVYCLESCFPTPSPRKKNSYREKTFAVQKCEIFAISPHL